jgi:adenosylhomocysteinase
MLCCCKRVIVCGYGDVEKELLLLLEVLDLLTVTEIDPICALQAAMDGFEVKKLDTTLLPLISLSQQLETRHRSRFSL